MRTDDVYKIIQYATQGQEFGYEFIDNNLSHLLDDYDSASYDAISRYTLPENDEDMCVRLETICISSNILILLLDSSENAEKKIEKVCHLFSSLVMHKLKSVESIQINGEQVGLKFCIKNTIDESKKNIGCYFYQTGLLSCVPTTLNGLQSFLAFADKIRDNIGKINIRSNARDLISKNCTLVSMKKSMSAISLHARFELLAKISIDRSAATLLDKFITHDYPENESDALFKGIGKMFQDLLFWLRKINIGIALESQYRALVKDIILLRAAQLEFSEDAINEIALDLGMAQLCDEMPNHLEELGSHGRFCQVPQSCKKALGLDQLPKENSQKRTLKWDFFNEYYPNFLDNMHQDYILLTDDEEDDLTCCRCC